MAGAPFFKNYEAQPCVGRSQWADYEDVNFSEIRESLSTPNRHCLFKLLVERARKWHLVMCVSRDMVVSEYLRARLCAMMFLVEVAYYSPTVELRYKLGMQKWQSCKMVSLLVSWIASKLEIFLKCGHSTPSSVRSVLFYRLEIIEAPGITKIRTRKPNS